MLHRPIRKVHQKKVKVSEISKNVHLNHEGEPLERLGHSPLEGDGFIIYGSEC